MYTISPELVFRLSFHWMSTFSDSISHDSSEFIQTTIFHQVVKGPTFILWFVISAKYFCDTDSKLREESPRRSDDAGVYGRSVTGCNKTCSCLVLATV